MVLTLLLWRWVPTMEGGTGLQQCAFVCLHQAGYKFLDYPWRRTKHLLCCLFNFHSDDNHFYCMLPEPVI